jgi:hypothetical protein
LGLETNGFPLSGDAADALGSPNGVDDDTRDVEDEKELQQMRARIITAHRIS